MQRLYHTCLLVNAVHKQQRMGLKKQNTFESGLQHPAVYEILILAGNTSYQLS